MQRIAGLLTNAMVTGLFFLRFTKVDAPLRFSRNLCLSCSPGGHLSCRFVTGDPTYWLRVSYSMVLSLDEEIEPGVVQRRLHSLPLLQLHHYRIDVILEGHVFDDLDALHRTRLIGAPSDAVRSDPSKRTARR